MDLPQELRDLVDTLCKSRSPEDKQKISENTEEAYATGLPCKIYGGWWGCWSHSVEQHVTILPEMVERSREPPT